MTNEQILKKAIEKAVKNGWEAWNTQEGYYTIEILIRERRYYSIIFSHDFARAFWGDGKRNEEYIDYATKKPVYSYQISGNNWSYLKRWQHHLQQMVLEEEPLKYLEKFLEEK